MSDKTQTALERFTDLLGADVFFVPCEWGAKEPLVTYVERPFDGSRPIGLSFLFLRSNSLISCFFEKFFSRDFGV